MNSMKYILIDESGRLYDPEDRILVFSAVVTDNLTELERIIVKARKRIPKKGNRRKERLSEIKFSLAGGKTKRFILQELAKQKLKIYNLIIDKGGRKIIDNPKTYALLIGEILKILLPDNPQLSHIIIDRHFTFITQREIFNHQLQKQFGDKLFIEHVDSLQNPIITLADFVAGAVRIAYSKKQPEFIEYIKNIIATEKLTTWREIKSGKS